MAWDGWPLTSGTSKRLHWKLFRQLTEALRERQEWMFSTRTIWPRTNLVWDSGTITGLVDNGSNSWTLTDSAKAAAPGTDDGTYWNGTQRPAGCTFSDYWVSVDCTAPTPDLPYIPAFFDIIIQVDDDVDEWYRDQRPWAVIRGDITANTSQTITFTANLPNYVTAKAIPADPATSLIGKRYYIIKTGGLWWADKDFNFGRYPDWPNHREDWRGKLSGDNDVGKMFTDGTGYIYEQHNKVLRSPYDTHTPATNTWQGDAWVDKEVLIYDSDGNLKRLVVTGNNADTIFFGGIDHIPTAEEIEEDELVVDYQFADDGAFTVVRAGSRGWPERKWGFAHWWYGGAPDNVYTHNPDDTIVARTRAFAADSVSWEELEDDDEVACGDPESIHTEHNALDADIWSSVINQCSPADFCFSPQLFKSPRIIQVGILSLIPQCIQAKDADNNAVNYDGAKEIRSYSIAQAFFDCAINTGASSMQSEVSGANTIYYFTVATPFKGASIYWDAIKDDVRKSNNDNVPSASDVNTGRVVVATVLTSGGDHTWAGSVVVYTAGFTRWKRREFTHLYARGAFIPDIKTTETGRELIYPPAVDDFCGENSPPDPCANDCFGVGLWIWRDVSTGYKTYSDYGYAQDGANDFVASEAARYVGDGWADPGTGVTYETDDDIEDLPYWDRFYEGQHPKATQLVIRQQRSGTITAASPNSLTDDTQDWYVKWFTPNGVMRTESGIATDGSTTMLVTDTNLTDPEDEAHCWWQSSRWASWVDATPYKYFVIEIDKTEDDGEGGTVTRTYKALITDVTNNTEGNAPVIHFEASDNSGGSPLTVEAGDHWRIVEPATTVARWRGRRVKITPPGGTPFELEILGDDQDTLFFERQTDPTKIPQVGWVYEIIEYETGGVWKFQTTEPTNAQKAAGAWQKIATNKYWVQPTGADVRNGNSSTWHEEMTENLAHLHDKMFGLLRKGDSDRLHVFDECYNLLNRLVWTKRAYSWTANGNVNEKSGLSPPQPAGQPTWQDAKDFAEHAYNNDSGYEAWHTEATSASAPYAYTIGYSLDNECVQQYGALRARRYAFGTQSGIPNLIASKMLLYAKAQQVAEGDAYDHNEWNNYGDDVLEGVYSEWFVDTPKKDATRTSGSTSLGDDTPPDWSSGPGPRTPCSNESVVYYAGYEVVDAIAIHKWNVNGGTNKLGLRYIDWTVS